MCDRAREMPSNFRLSKGQIIKAFTALNAKLSACEVTGEVCVFGGAAMVLAFDARQSTRDVDAVFAPKSAVSEAVSQVASDLGLPANWLNDGVKGWLSAAGDVVAEGMPQFSHLRVLRPTASYLLAMKCLAARTGGYDSTSDRADALTLIRHLGLSAPKQALEIVCRYYPEDRLSPKTRYFIEEVMSDKASS